MLLASTYSTHIAGLLLSSSSLTLLFDIMEDNENEAKECIDEDVHDVDVNAKVVLQFFDVFYDRAVILFFIGKLPYINWIKQ